MEIYKYIKAHNTLNPKLWNNFALKEDVKDAIFTIANSFIDYIKDNGVEIDVEDIYLLGSNASYNYNVNSDIDVHIMVRMIKENVDFNPEYLLKLYMAYRNLFKDTYSPEIKGIPVELYVEDFVSNSNMSEGVYSLTYGWLKKPKKEKIEINSQMANDIYDDYVQRFNDLLENISNEDYLFQIEKINNFIEQIYNLRKKGLGNGGEFSPENIVFKELRSKGYIDLLKEIKTKLETKRMSLN